MSPGTGGPRTVLLLGAGASVEAGVPMTAQLTHAVIDSIASKAATRADEREERIDAEHRELVQNANLKLPGAAGKLDEFRRRHPDEPLPRLKRESALQYVYNKLRAAAALKEGAPLELQIDLETVVATLELLAERSKQGLSAFVNAWDPGLLRLDHQGSGLLSVVALDSFDARLWNFVETVIEKRLSEGDGRLFERARQEVIAELPDHLTVDPERTAYLDPIGRWAKASGPATVATLNFDRTIEAMADRLDLVVDTGISLWRDEAELTWSKNADIQLIKLHGSDDWDRELIFKNDRGFLLGGPNKLTADGPYLDLIQAFRRALIAADRVVIIGYSRRDAHINSVIRRAAIVRARSGRPTAIELVDPGFEGDKMPRELDPKPEDDKAMITFQAHRSTTSEALAAGLLSE